MEKPEIDSIEGLSPAISIEQKATARNPRSTVGTVTEIHDYLRLLFAHIGKPHCWKCGKLVEKQTPFLFSVSLIKASDLCRFFCVSKPGTEKPSSSSGKL